MTKEADKMLFYDIIRKKRDKLSLTKEEIEFLVNEIKNENIPDYQVSSLLMAIFINGMDSMETTYLTNAMAYSGEIMDLSGIDGIKVDKHSTGGVGDKTTLVLAPLVAACGGKVAKLSGRGLGHTGGTIDKLESIPNFDTSLSIEKFIETVNEIGACVIGQTADLAPVDKKIYALRDVTATVDSIPLIASSVMSKKLASGADAIVLDVKCGSGAFMKDMESAVTLSKTMVDIAVNSGRDCVAMVTDMDVPLGINVGNSLEVIEAVDVLNGSGPEDLRHECENLATEMLVLSKKGTEEECRKMVKEALDSGKAFNVFVDMVEKQGGDVSYIKDTSKFPKAKICKQVKADKRGYIYSMDSTKCGMVSVTLGAGRRTKESPIDFSAGMKIYKKKGQFVECGEVIAELFTNNDKVADEAVSEYLSSIEIRDEKPKLRPQLIAKITKSDTIIY